MSIDGKLLARARERLRQRREMNEESQRRHREAAYARNPKLREIDARLRATVIDAVTAAMCSGGDISEALTAIREENLELQERRGMELARCGLPIDYLEESYLCPKCHDTGYVDGEMCDCLRELYREEQRRELSGLLKLGVETFDSFDLTLYSPVPDPATGVSPRSVMETVYEMCMEYARKFSGDSLNLFLSGGPGLGKTFLSTCIAKVVSERGFSVVYDTAASIFAKYEAEKFGRGDIEEARREVRRLESCDLLIIDDLGTEFATALVNSSLYTLLNNRLVGGKKTVINSNLTLRDLEARYSAPILSRLLGGFHVLKFAGTDIRIKKKEQGS